jgi:cytochrome c-type biogenesis protein CcmH/NrfF
VLSILIWWAVPVAAAVLAAIVIAIVRRVRAARGDVETMDHYRRAREVLARASADGVAASARPGSGSGRAQRE